MQTRFAVFACTIAVALFISATALPPESRADEEDVDYDDADYATRTLFASEYEGKDPVQGTALEDADCVGSVATCLGSDPFCCCVKSDEECPALEEEDYDEEDDFGVAILDAIKPRVTGDYDESETEDLQTCSAGTKRCCYSSQEDLDQIQDQCKPIGQEGEPWEQKCSDPNVKGGTATGLQCGERFPVEAEGLGRLQSQPYEFPWTCLVFGGIPGKEKFLGSCAIIPNNKNNDISQGTDRVITATHKLKSLKGPDRLKVRIAEYDKGSNRLENLETVQFKEFTVQKKRNHPKHNPNRLSHDVTILFLAENIDLTSSNTVNAACLPTCANMFDYQFANGTGTRCWVAGWGKDREDGDFQMIQKKIHIPIEPNRAKCEKALEESIKKKGGISFKLDESEICAGGEKGKDACEGDGGAPLVCQANTGRWYVMGLVTWGSSEGCGTEYLPGVYANVHNMLDFILSSKDDYNRADFN